MATKIKGFMASLYSYEYEPQEITNSEDQENDEINFIKEHDEEEEGHTEVVKSKMERKKPKSNSKHHQRHQIMIFVMSTVKWLKHRRKSLISYCIHHLNHHQKKKLYKNNAEDKEQ